LYSQTHLKEDAPERSFYYFTTRKDSRGNGGGQGEVGRLKGGVGRLKGGMVRVKGEILRVKSEGKKGAASFFLKQSVNFERAYFLVFLFSTFGVN